MVKLATMLAFIAIGGTLLLSGHVPPQYTTHGGFLPNGPVASLLALTFALYTFGGVEIVAITTGESRWRRGDSACGLLHLCDSDRGLPGRDDRARRSDAMGPCGRLRESVCHRLSHGQNSRSQRLMNFVILTAALSGANANLYSGSRMLFSLAREDGRRPNWASLNAAGSPKLALLASSYGIVVALVAKNGRRRTRSCTF